MAKKSNKTEHVLRLITKNDEAAQDDFFDIDQEISEKYVPVVVNTVQTVKEEEPEEDQSMPEALKELTVVKAGKIGDMEKNPKEPPAPAVRQEAPVPPTVRAFRDQEKSHAVPDQSAGPVNIAELLVKEKAALVMERMKVCTCRTCVNDVLALALNSLPAKYVAADAARQYFQRAEYKKKYETDILAALTKACVRVKASPRH